MKGRIDRHGSLLLQRGTKFKPLSCPFQENETLCGDWCPLFGEPVNHLPMDSNFTGDQEKPYSVSLKLCRTELSFQIDDDPKNFEDQRE